MDSEHKQLTVIERLDHTQQFLRRWVDQGLTDPQGEDNATLIVTFVPAKLKLDAGL